MTAEGLIAQTPAGPALLAIRDQAACDPAEIRAIATRWRNTANKIGTDTGTLNGAVKNVDDVWEGASANDFVKYMQKYNWAGQELHDALTNCATTLDTLATTLQETKTSITTIYDTLVTQVTTYLKKNPKATTANIETAVNTARTNAQDHLTAAATAMDTTASTLRRHLNDRAILFADINPPHKDPFTSPTKQHPLDWQKTPLPESVQTQLAGVQNGGDDPVLNGGGAGSGGYGPSGAPPGLTPPAAKPEVVAWIKEALTILRKNGVAVNPDDPATIDKIWTIIFHESGGNPEAINNWDSNAAAGIPSKGLMQTIDPTFQAHKQPGYGDIWNPVHNIMAGVRYTLSRYGSLDGHPGIASINNGGGYRPY
ncbi:WXG100 family type VII secretion target [Streptosporangium lutulentum]|uniref:WXG100 family type VII secretion target n=2 Tax=Streptosporangium lutulentum TaxID=1461250 RepID=A0ABT9QT05_9ACTN|nr:WXG100 family type VII secretion target [Streptosporangium lutulentum]MDP9849378.1 WXG100 family type VII secretion target [Streptosporangium lutulentum]